MTSRAHEESLYQSPPAAHLSRQFARPTPDTPLMRTSLRLRRALAIAVQLVPAAALWAQDASPSLTAYTPTLTFGTGLINAPVAWVSPEHGDIWMAASARGFNQGSATPRPNGSIWDLTMTADAHLFGRMSLGGSVYSTTTQQVGAHASVLLYRQQADLKWLPSLAVGVRNLGASSRQDRYVTGVRRVVDALPASQRAAKSVIDGSPSIYGVATREFAWDKAALGLTVGYGTGLFKNNGGMDSVYNQNGTLARGLFLGARLALPLSPSSRMSLVMENDGWDWNAGVVITAGHVTFGLMATELEETKGIPANEPLANWTKTNLILGYNGSIPDIIRGSRQRAEAVELELEARRLRREVQQRDVRMRELSAQIARARLRADAESAAQRTALEKALESERDAAKRASDRLQKVKPGSKPPEIL